MGFMNAKSGDFSQASKAMTARNATDLWGTPWETCVQTVTTYINEFTFDKFDRWVILKSVLISTTALLGSKVLSLENIWKDRNNDDGARASPSMECPKKLAFFPFFQLKITCFWVLWGAFQHDAPRAPKLSTAHPSGGPWWTCQERCTRGRDCPLRHPSDEEAESLREKWTKAPCQAGVTSGFATCRCHISHFVPHGFVIMCTGIDC